ncbi:MAG: DUF4238 domain-containing protein [Actinomycetales bacterium]|nr:DUF4238 domain-containing protein [Actinomycetales bacterium]
MTTHSAKRHHTVPQFYLRGFAENDQIVTIQLPGEQRFIQSVRDASVAKGFYAVEGHPDGNDVIEKAISGVEGTTAGIFKKIGAGSWPLGYDDRMNLGYFIALQATRVPAQRRTMDEMARQMLRLQIGAGGKPGLRRMLEKQGGAVSDELVESLWALSTRSEGPPIERPRTAHIKQMLDLAEHLLKYLVGRPWSLIHFDRRSLITSDAPVGLVRDPRGDGWQGVGFMTAWGITFPLSRKVGLLLGSIEPLIELDVPVEAVHRGTADMVLTGTTQLEKFFNFETAANASQYLFHHPEDVRFVPEELPEPAPVTMAFGKEPIQFSGEPWFPIPKVEPEDGERAPVPGAPVVAEAIE